LREGLESLEHEEREFMAQSMRVNYIKTPILGGLMRKRHGDKEKQKEGEKSKKSKQKTQNGFIQSVKRAYEHTRTILTSMCTYFLNVERQEGVARNQKVAIVIPQRYQKRKK